MTRPITWIAALGIVAICARLAAEDESDASTAIANGSPAPTLETSPQPDFVVRSTITRNMLVEEAPEMAGLPSVKGRISVTLNRVDDPKLPDPPPSPPPLDPNDPAVQARLAELREIHKPSELVVASAYVYDHSRTLVRWHPNGQPGVTMSAWSNIDFNHFCGFATYQVRNAANEINTYDLIMAASNLSMSHIENPPVFPVLPPLADGPAFVLVEGDASNREAMQFIEGMHELYRLDGARMEQAYEDRTRAQEERRAFLLANPPQPKDVTIHFWKREQPVNTQTEGDTGE